MPPSVNRWLLAGLRALLIVALFVGSLAPMIIQAAPTTVSMVTTTGPLSLSPEENPPPMDDALDEIFDIPGEPVDPPLQLRNLIILPEPPQESSDAPLADFELSAKEPISPQPESVPTRESGFDVPVDIKVSQDRYVMKAGETTEISLVVYPHTDQVPRAFQLTLAPASGLVAVTSPEGSTWQVLPLAKGEKFAQSVRLQITSDQLAPSGAVISFTVEAATPGFHTSRKIYWLGLLPASEPAHDGSRTVSQQNDQGAVLQYKKDEAEQAEFTLLAPRGAVPAGTQFTYTTLTPVIAAAMVSSTAPYAISNPNLFATSRK